MAKVALYNSLLDVCCFVVLKLLIEAIDVRPPDFDAVDAIRTNDFFHKHDHKKETRANHRVLEGADGFHATALHQLAACAAVLDLEDRLHIRNHLDDNVTVSTRNMMYHRGHGVCHQR